MNQKSQKLYILSAFSFALAFMSYFTIDKFLVIFLHNLNYSQSFVKVLLFVEYWTDETRIIFIALVLTLISGIFWYKQNYLLAKKIGFIILSFIVVSFVAFTIKVIVARARPDLLFSYHTYGLTWFSMTYNLNSLPSGHACVSFAIALSTACVFKNKAVLLTLFILATIISIDRVLIIHHYLSDVLFGIGVTSLSVGILYQTLCKKLGFIDC